MPEPLDAWLGDGGCRAIMRWDQGLWVLAGHEPRLATPAEEHDPKIRRIEARRVAFTVLSDECFVSTVFLMRDHGFGEKPLLFETMVFGGPLDAEMERYSTWDEAVAGHAAMVARCEAEGGP